MNFNDTIKSTDNALELYRELYESNYDSIINICNRYAKNSEQAKEMLKEGFIDIFSTSSDFSESFMRKRMIDVAVNLLKRNKQEYNIVGTVKALETYGMKEEEIIDEDIVSIISSEKVINALRHLSPAYRVIINLKLVDGYSFSEISLKLELAESTARMNYEKAIYGLRKLVKKYTLSHE